MPGHAVVWLLKCPVPCPHVHILQSRSNHTRWFWRDRRRAHNEQTALGLITPYLEDAYAAGGELKPAGLDFGESCLVDKAGGNGTAVYRSRLRAAITVRTRAVADTGYCSLWCSTCIVFLVTAELALSPKPAQTIGLKGSYLSYLGSLLQRKSFTKLLLLYHLCGECVSLLS